MRKLQQHATVTVLQQRSMTATNLEKAAGPSEYTPAQFGTVFWFKIEKTYPAFCDCAGAAACAAARHRLAVRSSVAVCGRRGNSRNAA